MSLPATIESPIARPIIRQHRAFCHHVAGGMTNQEAYHRSVSRLATDESARRVGSVLAQRYRQYIAGLRQRICEQADAAGIMGKVELMQWRSRALRTPAADAAQPHSDLATVSVSTTSGPNGDYVTTKVTGPDKTTIAAHLAREAGYESPAQHQHIHALVESPALSALARLVAGQSIGPQEQPVSAAPPLSPPPDWSEDQVQVQSGQ